MYDYEYDDQYWDDYEQDGDSYRNRRRDHRDHVTSSRPPRSGGSRPPRGGGSAPRPRPPGSRPGGIVGRPVVVRPHPTADHAMMTDGGDYLSIKKSAIAQLIPIGGQIWASFLARPAPPLAVGNDIVDRDNATLHRDALAMHQQNQTRLLALSDLASRLVKLFV